MTVTFRWALVCGPLMQGLAATACSRTTLGPLSDELSWCWPNCPATAWGDFAATLDVPQCPEGNAVLTVNTTGTDLEGGATITDPSQAGATLSFLEALWIASNRGTPHNIFFEAAVFPAAAPGTIVVQQDAHLPPLVADACIDGRHRGVILRSDGTSLAPLLPSLLDSLVVGLTLANTSSGLPAMLRMQISGCRFQQAFAAATWGAAITTASASTIGPGNVFDGLGVTISCCGSGIYSGTPDVIVRDNYFGFDPLSDALLPFADDRAIVAHQFAMVSGNVFGALRRIETHYADAGGPSFPSALVMEGNFAGVDTALDPLGPGALGLILDTGADAPIVFGPDNVIRGVQGSALTIEGTGPVQVTRDSISGNGAGIVYADTAPVAAPVITLANRTRVEGTCSVPGRIEIFSDPGDQAESYLGEATCNAISPWQLTTSLPGGRNVTATLTEENLRTSTFSAPVAVP